MDKEKHTQASSNKFMHIFFSSSHLMAHKRETKMRTGLLILYGLTLNTVLLFCANKIKI